MAAVSYYIHLCQSPTPGGIVIGRVCWSVGKFVSSLMRRPGENDLSKNKSLIFMKYGTGIDAASALNVIINS